MQPTNTVTNRNECVGWHSQFCLAQAAGRLKVPLRLWTWTSK